MVSIMCESKNDIRLRTSQSTKKDDERSKREDSLLRELLESCPGKLDISENAEPPLVWDKDLNFIGNKVLEEMRCSEHCGNTVRDK